MTNKELEKLIEEFDRFPTRGSLISIIEGMRQLRITQGIDDAFLGKVIKRVENWIKGTKDTKDGTFAQR